MFELTSCVQKAPVILNHIFLLALIASIIYQHEIITCQDRFRHFFFEKSNFEVNFGLYEKSNVKLFVDLQRENLNIVQLQADIFQNQN